MCANESMKCCVAGWPCLPSSLFHQHSPPAMINLHARKRDLEGRELIGSLVHCHKLKHRAAGVKPCATGCLTNPAMACREGWKSRWSTMHIATHTGSQPFSYAACLLDSWDSIVLPLPQAIHTDPRHSIDQVAESWDSTSLTCCSSHHMLCDGLSH